MTPALVKQMIDTSTNGYFRYKIGIYTGDGTQNRFINLGVTPFAVIISSQLRGFGNQAVTNRSSGGLAITGGAQYLYGNDQDAYMQITTNGFIVNDNDIVYINTDNVKYNYLAFY